MKKNPRKRLLPWGIGRAIDSIRKEDERGLLYYMDYKANYYTLEKYTAMIAGSKPGCSTFYTHNEKQDALLGRNYDFCHFKYNKRTDVKDSTGLIIVVRTSNPKARYKTLGVIDGFWLDYAKGTYFEGAPSDGVTDMTRLAMAPFVIMDGINEMGLATSIMHLPTENEWKKVDYREPESLSEEEKKIAVITDEKGKQPERLDISIKHNALFINTTDKITWKANKNLAVCQKEEGKESILHPILMRKMLDYCKDVDEAIAMARSYNLVSPLPDNDYHIMLSDKSGRSVILEWVNNQMKVVERDFGTNYYLSREDHYGYGHDRDEVIQKAFEKKKVLSEEESMKLLKEVSQDPFKKQYVGFTLWSSVYNLNKGTLDLSIFLDYKKKYEYKI